MRVLHVVPSVAARDGGPSAAVLQMSRALAREGVDVLIACTDADGAGRLDVPLGTAVTFGGTTVTFFSRRCTESYKYSPALAAWLDRHVSEFDVVHVHAVMSHAPIAAGSTCRRARVPYIVRPLGTLDAWSMAQKPLRKRVFMRLAGRRLVEGASAVHCTSQEECDSLAAMGILNGVVIPLGIDESPATDRPSARAGVSPYVLTISRLHPVKSLELLIEAFAAATADDSRCHWRLKIAGDGDREYVAALRRLAEGSRAANRIDFPGWIDGAVKHEMIAGAEIFALTSHHENFGLALAEALALGVPAVTSRGVQVGAAIERAGAGWVVPLEKDAIRSALADAMSDAPARERRGAAARALAAQWAWPRVAGQLLELYRRVAQPASQSVPQPAIARAEAGAK